MLLANRSDYRPNKLSLEAAKEDVHLGNATIVECSSERLGQCLAWIHQGLADDALASLTRDAYSKLREYGGPLPLVAHQVGQPVAAAYFKRLPGQVATLGGVRAAVGFEEVAVEIVRQLHVDLQHHAIPQIQAVVDVADQSSAEILRRSGFEWLTNVQHLYLDLSAVRTAGDEAHSGLVKTDRPRGDLRWLPANHIARSRVENLVAATFEGTLDCPALNELRDPRQVLEGMLDGREFRRLVAWDVLALGRKMVGCLFLTQHPQGVTELAYMGLIPPARGQKLGRLLVSQAIERAVRHRSNALVVAVDEHNQPALRLYQASGFRSQQQLSVWLLRR